MGYSVWWRGYGLDDRGSTPGRDRDSLSSPPHLDRLWRPTHLPILWVRGGGLFSGVGWLGREAEHSAPSGAEVKNAWSYTSTPQYVFMVWCLVKHRDNFTLVAVSEYSDVFFWTWCDLSSYT
jgi:hypothetical protein